MKFFSILICLVLFVFANSKFLGSVVNYPGNDVNGVKVNTSGGTGKNNNNLEGI
jgi:hypothetical protein